MLDSLRILIALKVISSKLPIGVATKYNVPDMLKKIISYIVLVFILTCCTLTSNEYSKEDGKDIQAFKSKNLVLSSSRLNSNIDIIFFDDKNILQKSFKEGIKNGYFTLRERQKRNAAINFIDFSKDKLFDCSYLTTRTKK